MMKPIDTGSSSCPLRRRLRRLSSWERRVEAEEFLREFQRETGQPDAEFRSRLKSVRRSLRRHGFYEHSPAELEFGARTAWRNSARCIGRLTWRSLEVIDRRAVTEPDEIAMHTLDHMREACARGSIRSMITIFPPVRGSALPPWIENRQVVQYAGHQLRDGGILGDPMTAEFTRTAAAMGWRPSGRPGRFDVLPLMIRGSDGHRRIYPIPDRCIREVAIRHPRIKGFDQLGLRWYAVPLVSGMILTIGGIDYPCAPFNGHYMVTEVASRNLGDQRRYDVLGDIAPLVGVDPSRSDPMWKDRALLELNTAVLWSFREAGVTMIDHHAASQQYIQFVQSEAGDGRTASAEWPWIVPPEASASCPVFHMSMQDRHLVPNFYHGRASDGGLLAVNRDDEPMHGIKRRALRIRQRWLERLRERER